jgi:hypothetical protein
MHRQWLLVVGALAWSAAGFVACGDDTEVAPLDGGTDASVLTDSSAPDSSSPDGAENTDSSQGGDADAAPPPPTRLLLSLNGSTQSELAAFGLQSRVVDGRLVYPDYIGTTVITPSSPFLLEQGNDIVARLDPLQPWVTRSSWNVALNDYQADAGLSTSYSDPIAVVVGAGTKAYVLRYTRNLIAVIDTASDVDGGAPMKTIDLSSQVQAGGDGYVEMSAGWFDPANNYVYVLLANINRNNYCGGYCFYCSNTNPQIVAIDTATDQLVSLASDAGGDAGGTSGVALPGYNPAFGPTAMVYDPPNNRLLVLHNGCNPPTADGGAGPVERREVDAFSLTDGTTKRLLDLTGSPFPTALFYADQHHVIVQLDTAYMWDPTTPTLGPAIPNAPQAFGLDGQGNLVGISQLFAADGGPGGWSITSVTPADGGVTVIGSQDPFYVDGGDAGDLFASGFVNGAQLWPAP